MPPIVPDLEAESALWARGVIRLGAVDEVGRGCLAGGIWAGAVLILPGTQMIEGVRDSKQLSALARVRLAGQISAELRVGLGAASVVEIDRLGINEANALALARAVARLGPLDHVLYDGLPIPGFTARVGPCTAIVDGDARCYSIAAASIVAKVARDRLMTRLAARHPGYGWERNAGYGSPEHLTALRVFGPTAHHRVSFAPLRQMFAARGQEGLIPGG
jgi:ribonuclease HII